LWFDFFSAEQIGCAGLLCWFVCLVRRVVLVVGFLRGRRMAATQQGEVAGLDMDLYSRQIGAFGVETMRNLLSLDVLVIGCRGVGAEAAKDLILAGPRSVTLYDPFPVQISDLGANCFLTPASVGKRFARARACCPPSVFFYTTFFQKNFFLHRTVH